MAGSHTAGTPGPPMKICGQTAPRTAGLPWCQSYCNDRLKAKLQNHRINHCIVYKIYVFILFTGGYVCFDVSSVRYSVSHIAHAEQEQTRLNLMRLANVSHKIHTTIKHNKANVESILT